MKYKINKGFIIQKLDDKTVIFDSDKSILYTFNETASYIFRKLKKGVTEKKLVRGIIKRYVVKEDRAVKDFKNLLYDLKKKKIISV